MTPYNGNRQSESAQSAYNGHGANGAAGHVSVLEGGGDGGGFPTSPANSYRARHEDRGGSNWNELDARVPRLKAGESTRINSKAIGFLVILVVLMAMAATWMFYSVVSGRASLHKTPPEVVNVPAAPTPPPPPMAAPLPPPIALAPPPLPVINDPPPALPPPPKPHVPTLLERRIQDSNNVASVGVTEGEGSGPAPGDGTAAPGDNNVHTGANVSAPVAPGLGEFALPNNIAYRNNKGPDKPSSATPLIHPDQIMTRGTYIRCVLETHIVTDVPGFTSCIVAEPVYSFTGKRLLLPKGSKLLGKYDTESETERVAVIWDRILTPNGIDVNMSSPGTDQLGGAGHPGYRDAHWGQRIGAALLISMLSDAFSYEANKQGTGTVTATNGTVVISPWQSNTAATLQSLANQAVRRSANRPDTITINQGTVVYVYVAHDVDFSAVVARS